MGTGTGTILLPMEHAKAVRDARAVGMRYPLLICGASVLYIFLAGWLGTLVLPATVGWADDGFPDLSYEAAPRLSNLFVRWDSAYYLEVARGGYSADGNERAYFPLYPILVRNLTNVAGGTLTSNGLVISLAAYLAGALMLFALVRREAGERMALVATGLLCFSPMSFFFVAFYPEALFLALSVASLYALRRGWFVAAGLAIALAGATRPTAFLLGIAYVVEVLLQRPSSWRALAGACLAAIGALAYYAYLGSLGNPLQGIAAYNAVLGTGWGDHFVWPWVTVVDAVNALLWQVNILPDWFSRAFLSHDFFFAVSALALAIWALPRMRLSFSLMLLAGALFIFFLHGPYGYAFYSAPRRLALVVPIYFALAYAVARCAAVYRWALLCGSGLWLGVLAAWFTSGRWVS